MRMQSTPCASISHNSSSSTIEMPVMNGLEAARALKGATHVVFVTAYDRYAIEAFERGAVDYVLKPLPPSGWPRRHRGCAIDCASRPRRWRA